MITRREIENHLIRVRPEITRSTANRVARSVIVAVGALRGPFASDPFRAAEREVDEVLHRRASLQSITDDGRLWYRDDTGERATFNALKASVA